MAKKSKIETPEWILNGESEKKKKKKKGKTFKVRYCPKCNSDNVGVAIGEVGVWECYDCKYKGNDFIEKELDEEEFMAYLDSKGVEVA